MHFALGGDMLPETLKRKTLSYGERSTEESERKRCA